MLFDILQQALDRYTAISKVIQERKLSYPKGNLRITTRKTGICYFHCIDKGDTTGVYIHKDNLQLAKQLAQKQYDNTVGKELDRLLPIMKKLAELLKQDKIQKCYTQLSDKRKALIKAFEISNEEYATQWLAKPYSKKKFADGDPDLQTLKGERVRSKSEVIIANTLKSFGIPYKYEQAYITTEGITLYPDFTVLNKKTRQEYILEHFGMMDNEKYALNTMDKIRLYMDHGFYPGEKLLFTYETSQKPLDTSSLSKLIKHYLL